MAKTRINRKGKEVPANARQRNARERSPSKKFGRKSDHGTKKHPRNY